MTSPEVWSGTDLGFRIWFMFWDWAGLGGGPGDWKLGGDYFSFWCARKIFRLRAAPFLVVGGLAGAGGWGWAEIDS